MKDGSTLPPELRPRQARERSWAAVGVDTSMTAIGMVANCYDSITGTYRGPYWRDCRWTNDIDYFARLASAFNAGKVMYDFLKDSWVREHDDIFIAVEQPWYYRAVKDQDSQWLQQTAEVSGAFKAGLMVAGYTNIYEISNSQWRAVVTSEHGKLRKTKEGGKWDIKAWAMQAYQLPDLPDLVKVVGGGKIPRPESGAGANRKAEQPNDIYDAAGCCAWMENQIPIIRAGR